MAKEKVETIKTEIKEKEEKEIKIEMLDTLLGYYGQYYRGKQYVVPENLAKAWIKADLALRSKEETAKAE
jgi:hypothetical protein